VAARAALRGGLIGYNSNPRDRRQDLGMDTDRRRRLDRRVAEAGEAALAERQQVSAIDVLTGLGWLHPVNVDGWRRGRIEYLEQVVFVGPDKLAAALEALRVWARERELRPTEMPYPARAREPRPLRFTASGDPEIESSYRTHWISPQMSENDRERLAERQGRTPDLVVISPLGEWTCSECGGSGDLLLMDRPGPICMRCADMDHLVFLPSGDAALTRRARRASRLSAVVVRFSRARKRYERPGVLVEESALERAEAECLADSDARAKRRERALERRTSEDTVFHADLAREIQRLYPACPTDRAAEIARHAGARGTGRVGRSAAGRSFDPEAIRLAVVASIRHLDTPYDELLMSGMDRVQARQRVGPEVERLVSEWQAPDAN
jgi:hypothetical protein